MATRKANFSGHSGAVYSLQYFGKPGQFTSAGADGQIVWWDVHQPDLGTRLVHTSGSIYAHFRDITSGQMAIGVNRDGIHVVEPESGKEVLTKSSTNVVWFRAISIQNQRVVFVGSAGNMGIWDPPLHQLTIFQYPLPDIRALAYAPDLDLIALGDTQGKISFIHNDSMALDWAFQAHQGTVFACTFYPVGQQLVTAGKDAHLKLWQLDSAKKIARLIRDVPAHLFGIHDIALHPTKPVLATGGMDKSIKIWDAETLKLLRVLDKGRHAGHGHSVNQLLWLPEPELLLSCSDDRTISAWDIFDET